MSDTMIEASDLTRYYGPTRALDTINLSVRRGEVMGFLGPNGAGKTTTMKILAGLLAPTAGTVRIGGIDMLEEPTRAKALVGYLPESPPLYDEMTVVEYLDYLATLRGVPSRRRREAVARAMERCGLTGVTNRLLRNLSKGFRQRTGIAQAIVHGPEVVILDEPTVGLDPIQVREIRALIRELGGEHSVLLSTHILPEVQMTCNRVALISQGRIVAEDTLEGLINQASGQPRIRMRCLAPPLPGDLLTVPGVARAEITEDGWLQILPREGVDPLPQLLRRAVDESWELRELASARSLEEIFVHLTTRETDAATDAATDKG